ncbi:hypothetical protein QG034_09795 [Kingella kingae]|uniref:hypothetical protein n=1 Tax=Kingella kingae TaxID=504 RepID=UPI00050A05CD|nr:hypothetical protein [Kingella kingae]MDK4527137.1 hypothetical protein [Kingella kingae]MDK4533229.1 hypothetical protein [Kingella kingae]
MINLYQLLQIAPDSSATEIQQALEQSRHRLNPKEIQAVESWLLVPEVRTRYNAQLRQKQPAFFQSQTSTIQPNVQAAFKPNHEQGYYTPKLYNPTIIVVLAILLSPLIGAWLCAINWRELGNREAANQNMSVVYGVLLFGLASALLYLIGGIEIPLYAGSLISLAWYFTFGKKQQDFLRQEAGDDYARKPWGKVVLWIIAGAIIYLIVFYALLFLLGIADLQNAIAEANQAQ